MTLPPEDFDLFCFQDTGTMLGILSDPTVTLVDGGAQFELNYPSPPGTSGALGVLSGDGSNPGFPTTDARISVEPLSGVPSRWTVEWVVNFESLPADFSDLVDHHIYLGASDGAGPVFGIFLSSLGVAYTGSVHHVAGDLVLDAPVQLIPGSDAYLSTGTQITIRLASDSFNQVTYLYITNTADIPSFGQRLVALLPLIDASDVGYPPIDQSLISVRGTSDEPSRAIVSKWCGASTVLVPNLPPVANAGVDQAARICSIVQFDGSLSFDPEGSPLTYAWRLIGAPDASQFTVTGSDGVTHPLSLPTGFTDKFYSVALSVINADDPVVVGDVVLVEGAVHTVVSTGTDGSGFYVLVVDETIPDSLSARSYRVYRQRGISGHLTSNPTFFPDVTGFYRFDLTVSDGLLDSLPSTVVVNVVDSPLPRGIIPEADFLFDYLSDYWKLLEDGGPIVTFWSSLAQIAASELFTLWQHDYGKSLRDIQRTFLRRWLHYDLLIGEPVPEMTTLRVFYGGRLTSTMAAGGVGGVSGTTFVVSSGVHANRTIKVLTANPVTASQLALEVGNRLLEVDSRYTTTVITLQSGSQVVRVNAPFPFTISSSTNPVMSNGMSTLASGAGVALGARVYRVDQSLLGLGLQEDDLLTLGGQSFRVAQVIDDPSDTFPFQRVSLKTDIPATGVGEWTLSGYVHSEFLDFYSGLIFRGDALYFEVVDFTTNGTADPVLLQVEALGVAEDSTSNLGFTVSMELGAALAEPQQFDVYLAKIVRRTYLPIDTTIVDIPTLIELIEIQDDKATLRRNLDFFIEEFRGTHCIRFVSGWDGLTGDVWEAAVPPDRLWAEYTYIDNSATIQANFGLLADLSMDKAALLPGNVDYLSAVRGLWYAYMNGPTLFNLRVGSQILLGLPFAEEAGTIQEIRTDFSPTSGRMLIQDAARTEIVRSYTFPRALLPETNPATGARYAAGDTVAQFAPLVEGVEIVDYVKDPKWFQGLLNQGIFYEPEKYFQFLVQVDSAAFGVEPLLFVEEFVLKIKPTYTYPFFLVTYTVGDTEFSVTDTLEVDVDIYMYDSLCSNLRSSTGFDDPRPSGGGYWNQFDTDDDPLTPPPTFPTPDASVAWAFDRDLLCPSDTVSVHLCESFAAPHVVSLDSVFAFDQNLMTDARFEEAGPFVVAAGPTGESITPVVGATVPLSGTINRVRILITGGPGSDPTNYTLVVAVNGTDQITQNFTSGAGFTNFSATVSQAVTVSDVLSARVRHSSGSARSPAWTDVRIDVSVDAGPWHFDQTLPAGNYCGTRVLA
jgi:hypothetical protein